MSHDLDHDHDRRAAPLPSFRLVFHTTAYVVISLAILSPAFAFIGFVATPVIVAIIRAIL